jgi:hypothetical protein
MRHYACQDTVERSTSVTFRFYMVMSLLLNEIIGCSPGIWLGSSLSKLLNFLWIYWCSVHNESKILVEVMGKRLEGDN